jgi:hypothetical protein
MEGECVDISLLGTGSRESSDTRVSCPAKIQET